MKYFLKELYSYPNGRIGFTEYNRILSNLESIFLLAIIIGAGKLIKSKDKKKFSLFLVHLIQDKIFHLNYLNRHMEFANGFFNTL